MIRTMRLRVLQRKLDTMAHTFMYGVNESSYVEELSADYVREQVAKHQVALSAVLDFDLDDAEASLEVLEEAWFATTPIFETALTEFKYALQAHIKQEQRDGIWKSRLPG